MSQNTLAGVNLARVAQRTLNAVTARLVPLKEVFFADFSDDVATGPTVTTRIPSVPVVKALLTAANRTADTQTTTAVTVTIGAPRGVDIGFDDAEVINSDIKLQQMFIEPGVNVIIQDIMAQIFAVVTVSTFPNEHVIAAASFDADNVSLLAEEMSTLQLGDPRNAIVKPTYYGPLSRDTAIQSTYSIGTSEVIIKNLIRQIHGINMFQFTGTIPSNSEHLEGFACNPEAIAAAARMPVVPENWYGQVESVVEPVTGLPIQFRLFYDGALQRLQMLTQSGVAAGHSIRLVRIVSSANS